MLYAVSSRGIHRIASIDAGKSKSFDLWALHPKHGLRTLENLATPIRSNISSKSARSSVRAPVHPSAMENPCLFARVRSSKGFPS
eukprot:8433328-Pyramimonas_sp.AAC.1